MKNQIQRKENLVLTVSIGDHHRKISEHTIPTIQKYAKRIGADFEVITDPNPSYKINGLESPDMMSFQKLSIYDYLGKYKRIIYLDIDLIIREDCPNLFDIVPQSHIGAMNEVKFEHRSSFVEVLKNYGEDLVKDWDQKYYNCGVLVVSRQHRQVFRFPRSGVGFGSSNYFNLRFIEEKCKIQELDWRFNRISTMDKFLGKSRLDSYIIHYAGAPVDMIFPVIEKDIKKWEIDGPEYSYPHNILISVSAGMGDQLCSEPAIRHTQKMYPDSNFYILTHHPRLFEHLDVPVMTYDQWTGIEDPIFEMFTCPDDKKSEHNLSHVLFHPVDFASMSMVKKTIPNQEKTIKLKVKPDEISSALEMVKEKPENKPLILIHAGKWWPSKTLPIEWWQEVVDGLSEKLCVCLIGKTIDEDQGYLPIECPKDGIDLRDLTTLGELISLISLTHCTLTNDSSPLHIAGAFDNWIVTIPTAKHPDHILPYRNGTQYYKTKALYKHLLLDDLQIRHTSFNTETIDKVPQGKSLYDYIPTSEDVIREVLSIYDEPREKGKITL